MLTLRLKSRLYQCYNEEMLSLRLSMRIVPLSQSVPVVLQFRLCFDSRDLRLRAVFELDAAMSILCQDKCMHGLQHPRHLLFSLPSEYFPMFINLAKCLTCLEARPNCVTCVQTVTQGPVCNQCEVQFYLDNYSCKSCPYGCLQCTSFSVCSSCIDNHYTVTNQMCTLCGLLIPNCL